MAITHSVHRLSLLLAAALLAAAILAGICAPVVYPKPPDSAMVYIQKGSAGPSLVFPGYMVPLTKARKYKLITYRNALEERLDIAPGADLRVGGPPLWEWSITPAYLSSGAWRHWRAILAYGSQEPYLWWLAGGRSWVMAYHRSGGPSYTQPSLLAPITALVIVIVAIWLSVKKRQAAGPAMLAAGVALFITWYGAALLIPTISSRIASIGNLWLAATFILLLSGGVGVVVMLVRRALWPGQLEGANFKGSGNLV